MTFEALFTLLVIAGMFISLQFYTSATDVLFLGALTLLTVTGIVTAEQALSGFANPAVIMVGAMLVVGAGMRSTGALDWLGHKLLGSAQSEVSALRRLAVVVTSVSAFVNNTTLVAMLMPVVVHWCRRRNVSPSKLLIPLSYLAIMGGLCTLIGTSTNVTVNGLLVAEQQKKAADGTPKYDQAVRDDLRGMSFFEIGYAGIPCALLGAAYLVLFSSRLLPDRTELLEKLGDERREYLVEMMVQPECRMIGQTVQEAGLRHLPGLFLIEIDRAGELIGPVSPDDLIHAGDRLVFTGVVSTIVDLEKIPGLVPAVDLTYEVNPRQRSRRHLTEAVISTTSPLVGQTIRDANFRQLYSAAVVAVHRNGQRVTTKIGDVTMQPGDTLLLQTRQQFASTFRNHSDFFLVSSVEGSERGRQDRARLAFGLLALLVLMLSVGTLIPASVVGEKTVKVMNSPAYPAVAAVIVGCLMIVFRCVSPADARSAIDLEILLTIAAGVGIGQALDSSGLARWIAGWLTETGGRFGPYFLLVLVYLVTLIITEFLSNNAAAALMFPLAVAMAVAGSYSPRPFVMAVCMAASAAFVTPIGYQTNLMVMGPGGYKPSDYARVGLPLNILMMAAALLIIPFVWPFRP